jgi:pyrimidine-nucleoside phosphorylase
MRAVDLIRKKRDGGELSREEIDFLVRGCTRGEIPDYQMAAWLMAVVLRGMSRGELAALTEAMLRSGSVLDFSDLPGKKVDKHSTGGVGDKTSLVVAPVAAAAGVIVPMISGRGLAHTGGTLDKLESIPGFRVNLTLEEFRRAIAARGCALAGQTDEIVPADKKLYALRDATATVESQELICASIMSKKLAEGIDGLVLDVKTGVGAFMKSEADAARLAGLMVETGERMGKQVVALVTAMDQPLGRKVGNALEVEESLEVLRGAGPDDLRELCLALAGWMLLLGGRADSFEAGRELAAETIASGRALETFRAIARGQGGDERALDDPARLPRAAARLAVPSPADGWVAALDAEQVGWAVVLLGGGRDRAEDRVDPAVGIVLEKKVGERVKAGEPLCSLHYNAPARLEEARRRVEQSYRIAPEPPPAVPALVRRVLAPAYATRRNGPRTAGGERK